MAKISCCDSMYLAVLNQDDFIYNTSSNRMEEILCPLILLNMKYVAKDRDAKFRGSCAPLLPDDTLRYLDTLTVS